MTKPLVVITGSSGLIGTRVAEALQNDHRVVGFDVKPPARDRDGIDFIRCDLIADDGAKAALETVRERHGGRIASVVHLAAYYDFSGEPSPLYETLTVGGTRRLLRALQALEVEQFVFSSSLLVMKPAAEGTVIDESSPTQPEWDYPQSKIDAENVIHVERRRIPAVVLRIAGVYDDLCHSIPIAQQIRRIREKQLESFLFPGNPDHGQSFIHLDDLVPCVRRVIERRGALEPHEVFLIGEPEALSYETLQDRIGELLHGHEWPTLRIPASVAKAGAWLKEKTPGVEDPFIKPWMVDLADAHYPVSIERARERLGWAPRHRLGATLSEMIARLRADPVAWYRGNGLPLPAELERETEPPEPYMSADLDAPAPPFEYNPSSWRERMPICILAAIAFLIAAYMALYQWRLVGSVWDPVFGEESTRVLDSQVSERMRRWIGIPDAALGALAYLGDVVFGLAGSTRRWQYRPWMVLLFGLDVIPLGIVSAILVILQGTVVGAWCFLCLVTAAISLALVYLAYDEVWASLLYLRRVQRRSGSWATTWDAFCGRPSPAAERSALERG